MDPLYVFEGYSIEEPWVIVLALAHNYGRLKEVPSYETNGVGVCDVADQYGRGTRSSYALANWIRQLGYAARAYPDPGADALSLIPPAIASGLGELGKHGSLVSPQFGAGVRLAAVTTDMPLPRPSLLISRRSVLSELPDLYARVPSRCHFPREANGPWGGALVRQF